MAKRVGLELGHIHPRPPALRLFDAGMGDGTVLARVMREMHRRFPTVPFYIVGKEISLEDVRLSLRKMVDRFYEHPATVLVVTNMYYTEAPWLTPRSVPAATSMVWEELALTGTTAHDFAEQISELEPFLAKNWQARHSPKTGNPIYDHPTALVIYRDDYRFLLNDVIPKRGEGKADYDMVIASQPYRLRAPLEFKAQKVVGAAGARARQGRAAARHPLARSRTRAWRSSRRSGRARTRIPRAATTSCAPPRPSSAKSRGATTSTRTPTRAPSFRYEMHTLPSEISASIGTSTLFAAWNAAIYVAQIDDARLSEVAARHPLP